MLKTFLVVCFGVFLTVIEKKPALTHSPLLKASAHLLAHAAEMGIRSWSSGVNHSWGSGQRMCWESSALQLPSVITIHSYYTGKGLAMPTKTQFMVDLNKRPLNQFIFNTQKIQKHLQGP